MENIQTLKFRTITGYIIFAYIKAIGPNMYQAGLSKPYPLTEQPEAIAYSAPLSSTKHRGTTFVNASTAFSEIVKTAKANLESIVDTSRHAFLYIDNPMGMPLLSAERIQASFSTRQTIKIYGG